MAASLHLAAGRVVADLGDEWQVVPAVLRAVNRPVDADSRPGRAPEEVGDVADLAPSDFGVDATEALAAMREGER